MPKGGPFGSAGGQIHEGGGGGGGIRPLYYYDLREV